MPERDGKDQERIAQSKRARASLLAIVDEPHVAQTYIHRADVVLSFSGVTFILFCFRLFTFIEAAPFPSSMCMRPDSHTCSYLTTVCVLTVCFSFFFFSLEMSLFPSIFVPLPFSLCMESTLYLARFFLFRIMFFYLVTTG